MQKFFQMSVPMFICIILILMVEEIGWWTEQLAVVWVMAKNLSTGKDKI